MRLNRLDLNLLITLDALLTERSITRAAERIHLSQPATSGALARLREFFEDDLLVRVGAQMLPTPLGESLVVPVHNILMQIQTTVERRLEFNAAESDRCFRLLMSDYTATTLMTHVVKRVAKLAPKMQMEFIALSNNPAGILEQGEVDFLVMPEYVLSDGHPSSHIFSDEFVCIGWDQNPALQKPLTLKDYLDLGHVAVRFGSSRQLSQDQILLKERQGLELRVEIVTSTFSAIPQFLSGTNRIATVYSNLAKVWAEFLPLKIVPLPVKLDTIPWSLQWHKYRDADPGIQWLREQIAVTAKEVLAQPK